MTSFTRARDLRARRRMITQARRRGSMPPEIAADVARERRAGRIAWIEAGVLRAEEGTGGGVRLELDAAPGEVAGTHLVLATGFSPHRPGGALLDAEAVDRLGLPCAACGYPIVSRDLAWGEGLFVTGALAELELGPTARNIAGALAAATRVSSAA